MVARRLQAVGAVGAVELVLVETRADRRLDVPISSFGGQGAFVVEVDRAVLEGRAEAAVHSAKDLPTESPAGLVLAAVPDRAEVRDALVGRRLEELAPGALVATGAVRRRAQLAWRRPDLGFVELRGNIGTRLAKVPVGGAVVVALAALERLGLAGRVAEVLPTTLVLPQVGQGAIAVRCRESGPARALLAAIDDQAAHRALVAERAFLRRLGGGCEAPVGALAETGTEGVLRIEGLVASPDGHLVVRRRHEGDDPAAVGEALAEAMLAGDGVAELVGRCPP